MNNDDYLELLEIVDAMASGLSDWEISFVEDVLERRPNLSEKQREIILRMHDNHVEKRR